MKKTSLAQLTSYLYIHFKAQVYGNEKLNFNSAFRFLVVLSCSHPMAKEIFNELQILESIGIKELGFVPHTESVLHDLTYEEENLFSFHFLKMI